MKRFLKLFLSLAAGMGLMACSSDDPVPEITLAQSTSYSIGYAKGSTVTVEFNSTTDWSIDAGSASGVTLSATSGKKGQQSLVVTAKASNETNAARTYSFRITGSYKQQSSTQSISITQCSAFTLPKTTYNVSAKGETISIDFTFNDEGTYTPENLPVHLYGDEMFFVMSSSEKQSSSLGLNGRTRSSDWYMSIPIAENNTTSQRIGTACLAVEDAQGNVIAYSENITIIQEGSTPDSSTDYGKDGTVTQLQTHTLGAGIPVVIMGDAFIDRDVEDGSYDRAMNQAYEYLFSETTMKTLQEYFDVYAVTAVSTNNGIGHNTAFSTQYGEGTLIEGDDKTVLQYADKALNSSQQGFQYNNGLYIVVLNDDRYAGTCSIYYMSDTKRSIPQGFSVAYVPMTDPSKHQGIGFEQILHHEAIGHGFGKLADEYTSTGNDTLEGDELEGLHTLQGFGCFVNVTTESNVTLSPWAKLAADAHFEAEKLGCYEGGYTYAHGAYRPTEESIMAHNEGIFNAPSREIIYKRTMFLANQGTYTYDYDAFVEFDKPTWSNYSSLLTQTASTRSYAPWKNPPLAKPVVKIMKK